MFDLNNLDDLFFLNYQPEDNEEELKKTGNITKDYIENDGYITETFKYNSFDGKINFIRTKVFKKPISKIETLETLTEKLNLAIKNEDFLLAADYKKQIDNIK